LDTHDFLDETMTDERDQDAQDAPEEYQTSLIDLANVALRNWRLVFAAPLALALFVGLWSLSRERTYRADAVFMPRVVDGRAAGGALALAQQFGVSLGSESPGESPQFYIGLLSSLAILRQTVESEYEVVAEDGSIHSADLLTFWKADELGGKGPPWRRAATKLRKQTSTSVDREIGVIRLTVSATQPVLAEQIAQRQLDLLNAFNMTLRQSRAEEEGQFIAARVADAQSELRTAEGRLQEFLRHNREFRHSPDLLFEHDRMQRQVVIRQEVYISLLRAQEEARIDARRDTPVLSVIDPPLGSAQPQGRGTVLRTFGAFLFGLMVAFGVAAARDFGRRRREAGDPHYREFEGLARQTIGEFRRPRTWFGVRRSALPAGGRE
jgi:uncharacterized protein involved in exopolysaccharide biosynthesis